MTVLSERPTTSATPSDDMDDVVVVVDTELDIATLPQLRERLELALATAPGRLVVDLTDCVFLDAQAMNVLLDVHRQAWRQGGRLTLRGCSSQCLRLLALAGLVGVFDLEDESGIPAPLTAA